MTAFIVFGLQIQINVMNMKLVEIVQIAKMENALVVLKFLKMKSNVRILRKNRDDSRK